MRARGAMHYAVSQCLGVSKRVSCLSEERERERENYAEKGGNPFLHMLREWTLT